MSPRAASIKATGADSTIRHILDGRTKSPRLDTLEKIAQVLGCSSTWLMHGTDDAPRSNASPANVKPPFMDQMKRDIPVLGTAAGSALKDNGFMVMTDPIDYVRRPPALETAKGVYALYVEGDSMSPKYDAGDLVFIHPHLPPRIGDIVVVHEQNGHEKTMAFIKRLTRRTAEWIETEQYNPPATVKFKNSEGIKIHKVLQTGDLFGM
ncbi:XRE family transcriptional regulator [Maritalea sp.]|uniref:XRE family transcriptional regulator n=1 Tax=Maritalea sp. TaxID=2003361 RepID=UPI003EF5DE35